MIRIILGALLATLLSTGLSTGAFAQSSYKIQSGDSLQIEVIEDPSLNRSVLVLPDGSINFPLVGTIPAAGRSVEAVKADLAAALAGNFAAAPNVFVGIGALAPARTAGAARAARTMNVYAMGEVTTPGKAEVAPGTTILQLLAQAGGFTRFAAQKRVQLRRTTKGGGEQVYFFNYDGTGASGIGGSTKLQAGDVIVVPQRKLFE
jgi:polysaccharide biosynthesis/export protein